MKIRKLALHSRPMCDDSRFCLRNAGFYSHCLLQGYGRDVITAYLAVINWAESFGPGPDDRLVVFDTVALYPNLPVSMSRRKWPFVVSLISERIWQLYGNIDHDLVLICTNNAIDHNLALLLDSILHMILSNQFVHYDGAACYMKPGQLSALACTLLHTSLMCS